MSKKVLIIAEAGVNHNGSVELGKKLIDAAVFAQADIVKFQTFKTEQIVTQHAERAEYQIENTGTAESHWGMLKKLELSNEAFHELMKYSASRKIEFLSTPFDESSAKFLVDDVGVKRIKIPSGEITNVPLIKVISEFRKPVILSTGMSNLEEVRVAVDVLRERLSASQITLLHCTTSYPCPFEDVHLNAMQTLKQTFGLSVGYSDHTLGNEVSVAAVALGARVIEKHMTLSRILPGPDHKASLEPGEFKSMVESIRHVEKALGSYEKEPTASELKIRKVARKSLVAARDLSSGEKLSRSDLAAKRPGSGISPVEMNKFVGKRLRVNKKGDEPMGWSEVEETE